jgi:hypothetical protein
MAARAFIDGCNPRSALRLFAFPAPLTRGACLAIAEVSGGEQLTTTAQLFLAQADALCLCLDLSSRRSFERLNEWQEIAERHCSR